MSTLTPNAPVFSLVAASVTRVAGEVAYQSFPAGVFLSVPQPTVLITVVPTPATATPSAPSVSVGRGLLPSPVRFDVLAEEPKVSVAKAPLRTITPAAIPVVMWPVFIPPPKVNVRIGPSALSFVLKLGTVSVAKNVKTLFPDAVTFLPSAPSPAANLSLTVAPDPVPLSLLALEANAAVDVVVEPDEVPFKQELLAVPDVSVDFGEVTLLPEPATASHAVPSPSVLPGEKVLSVGPASLTASVAGPLVTEGQGQLRGYCLLTKTAEATCLLNVSLTVHSETKQE